MVTQVILGLFFSGLIAGVAFKKRSLSKSGALVAAMVGTLIYAFGNLYWYGLLLVFFISSSVLSHFKKSSKSQVEELFAKTGQRDAGQVMANGGMGAILAICAYFSDDPEPYMAVYLGIMSTVNADTWGTELGVLSRGAPHHILTWRQVEKGTSGGISAFGTLGTCLGALFIGGFAYLFAYGMDLQMQGWWSLPWIAFVSGVAGAMTDSILGATVQRLYQCTVCGKQTEKSRHCGADTERAGGFDWCSNDMVNFVSSMAGGGLAYLLWIM